MSIPQFDEIVYLSTEQEMEDKFSELGIMDVLPKCKPTPCSRDPEVNTLPPRNIVRHIRERGTLYFVNGSKLPIALIFQWDSHDGEPRRSIRWFIFGRVKYRLTLRDSGPTQENLSFPGAP
jgi:hypothetical protein